MRAALCPIMCCGGATKSIRGTRKIIGMKRRSAGATGPPQPELKWRREWIFPGRPARTTARAAPTDRRRGRTCSATDGCNPDRGRAYRTCSKSGRSHAPDIRDGQSAGRSRCWCGAAASGNAGSGYGLWPAAGRDAVADRNRRARAPSETGSSPDRLEPASQWRYRLRSYGAHSVRRSLARTISRQWSAPERAARHPCARRAPRRPSGAAAPASCP